MPGRPALPCLVRPPVLAQAAGWREYRRDDLGYRVEFPGEPTVENEEDEFKDPWIKTVDAKVVYRGTLMGVSYTEFTRAEPADETFATVRVGASRAGFPMTREIPLLLNGYPAREFIAETDHFNIIHRVIVMEKVTISVQAVGDRDIHRSAEVRRFLDSFKLLRNRP